MAAIAIPTGNGVRLVLAANQEAVARGVAAANTVFKSALDGRGGGSAALAQGCAPDRDPAQTLGAIGAMLSGGPPPS